MNPPAKVLDSFGIVSAPVPLSGGQGTTLRAGDVVLKPGAEADESEWVAHVYETIDQKGFRVPAPVRALDGRAAVDGWTAWRHIDGEEIVSGLYRERLAASAAFQRALKRYARPAFLDGRQDPWAVADRIVFDGMAWEPHERLAPVLARLNEIRKRLSTTDQAIHGDITQNLLAAPGMPLAVIDFSPYWRPAKFANAILVVDAIAWEHAPLSIAELAGMDAEFYQLLVRASLRRLYEVDCHHRMNHLPDTHLGQVNAYTRLVRWLEE